MPPSSPGTELCKTRSTQDYSAGGDQTRSPAAAGESRRGTAPPGQQTRAQQDEISWRWDFKGGNTMTQGELPFFQGEQSPSLLICKTFWRCDAHMALFIV